MCVRACVRACVCACVFVCDGVCVRVRACEYIARYEIALTTTISGMHADGFRTRHAVHACLSARAESAR